MSPTALEAAPAADAEAPEEEDRVNGLLRDHWDALNPCLVCGQHSHEGPEGESHVFGHCWKCGYRPAGGVAPSVPQARTGLTGAQIEQLTSDLRKGVVEDILAALKGGASLDQITTTIEPAEGVDQQSVAGAEGA